MSTQTKSTTETQTNAGLEPVKAPKSATVAAKELAIQAQSEADAYIALIRQAMAAGAELKGMALDAVARNLGQHANKFGKPTESAYLAFASAVAGSKLSVERITDLAKKANAAQREITPSADLAKLKPVATLKAKGSSHTGSASYRFNLPVAVEMALS